MAIARDLLKSKRQDFIVSVTPNATVLEAIKVMAENNVGALLVMQEGKIAGILSERDIVRKVDRLGKTSATAQVHEIMTEKVLYVNATQPIEECMALMTEKRIRHLPVLQGDELLGVISIGDVLRNAIEEREFIISQLEHYIRAGG
ncbi:MAG: histidine kinase [Chloroflexi bacterium HGW-Chloroflexi-6]|nr:MAG: histidine kinase [Chloroflexi bacterium HGW-Chloroflexi-6]